MSEFVIESITELFHLVKSLIPENQELVCVKPDTTVAEAVQIMRRHGYSQLPVTEGDAVLGIFSYRSFTSRLLPMGQLKAFVGDLPVDEFVEQISFVQLSDHWEHLLSSLDKDDAVLVGGHEQLRGLVTTMDVLSYLRKVASPFVLMAEIETSLRRVIRACVTEEELRICAVKGLASKYASEDDVPVDLTQMEFNDYAQIIGTRDNWPYFASVFGENDHARSSTMDKLHRIRILRNDVFHFRRKIEQQDIQSLTDFRDWLQRRARGYAARQKAQHASVQTPHSKETEHWDERSFMAALAKEHSPDEVAAAQAILSWAKEHMPVIYWGKGKVNGSFIPGLSHNGVWHQVIGVWTQAYVEIQFQYMRRQPVFDEDDAQLELIRRLNEIPGIYIDEKQVGKRPSIRLSTLADEDTLDAFLNVLNWCVDKIKLTKTGLADRRLLRHQFWSQLLEQAREQTSIHANISPSRDNWIAASSGLSGVSYNYAIRMDDARIELYIDRGNKYENERIFEALLAKRSNIEQSFGDSLEWLRMEDKQASIIRYVIEGKGGLRDQSSWPQLQELMIDAMVRFSAAIQPEISQLSL